MINIAGLSRSPALRIASRRSLQAIPVLWGATFVTFGLLNLLPGTAATALLGESATRQQIAELTLRLHLNEPFFVRYWHWLSAAVQGNLGASLESGQRVTTIIGQKLPVTAELVLFAFVIAVALSIPMALLAARHPRGFIDRMSIATSMFGLSTPNFVFALLLILIFAVHARILPAIGFSPVSAGIWPNIRSLILPAFSLAFHLMCHFVRVLRADLIDQMESEDYVITAMAKGASRERILVRHVLRNSAFALLTLIGLNLGTLFGGTVITEQIFAIPGMGKELLIGISSEDLPIVEGIVLVIAIAVVSANLLTDLLYVVLDPRIRHGRPTS